MRRILLSVTTLALALTACTPKTAGAAPDGDTEMTPTNGPSSVTNGGAEKDGFEPRDWVYQLSGYAGGKLDAVAATGADAAVFDLARDGGTGYFTADEVGAVQKTGKKAFSYFTIGSIEIYRPEAQAAKDAGLYLNQWGDWPDEYFVKYWDPAWWDLAMRSRVDQAIAAGFDGVYLDVPNAYEEIDLALVPGETRETLARKMVDLIVRISAYAKAARPGFLILPQNSPELAEYDGYTAAIDGLGIEELFYLATDQACTEDFCAENLEAVRRLRAAGKFILAVDYADDPAKRSDACAKDAAEGFAGYVGGVGLADIRALCP